MARSPRAPGEESTGKAPSIAGYGRRALPDYRLEPGMGRRSSGAQNSGTMAYSTVVRQMLIDVQRGAIMPDSKHIKYILSEDKMPAARRGHHRGPRLSGESGRSGARHPLQPQRPRPLRHGRLRLIFRGQPARLRIPGPGGGRGKIVDAADVVAKYIADGWWMVRGAT
jgi:hypothetical protein